MFSVHAALISSSEIEFRKRINNTRASSVYRAKYTPADPSQKPSFVAVKQLIHKNDPEPEAHIAVNAKHPNIIKCLGYIKDESYHGLVLELCKGEDLYDYLIHRDLSDDQSKQERELVALHIIKGLVYMHSLGIIHADIKTQNILIFNERKFIAKITDFNYSVPLEAGQTEAVINHTVGTAGWRAPEVQTYDESKQGIVVTVEIDIFGFGIILDLLTRELQGNPKASFNTKNPVLDQRYSTPTTRLLIRQCLLTAPQRRPTGQEIQQQFESGPKLFSY